MKLDAGEATDEGQGQAATDTVGDMRSANRPAPCSPGLGPGGTSAVHDDRRPCQTLTVLKGVRAGQRPFCNLRGGSGPAVPASTSTRSCLAHAPMVPEATARRSGTYP